MGGKQCDAPMFSSHLSSVVLSHPSNNCFTWIFEVFFFFFKVLFPISFVVDFISTCQLWIFPKFALCVLALVGSYR